MHIFKKVGLLGGRFNHGYKLNSSMETEMFSQNGTTLK